jgi:hypothetical protein
VAVDVVASWSKGGARLVVADAGFSTPLLHEALGIHNHEGLVDALRWGASVQRVIQRPEGRSFLALTAGTAVADTAAVLALPRWHALCSGFREAGVTLAILVPAREESLGAVLDEADGVVILAEPGEDPRDLVAGWTVPVVAVTGRDAPAEGTAGESAGAEELPSDDAPAEPVSGEGPEETWASEEGDLGAPPFVDMESGDEAEPDPVEASAQPPVEDTLGVESGESADAAPREDAPVVTSDAAGPPMEDGPAVPSQVAGGLDDEFVLPDPIPVPPSLEEIVEESEAPSRRRWPRVLLLLLLMAVAAASVAAGLGYLEIPGLTPSRGTSSPGPPPAPTVATMVFAVEKSAVQAYSLALGAYQDGAVATQRVGDLSARVPGVLFLSVPVEVEGTLFYRVLAGPAADSAAVLALASRIAESASLDPSPWMARWTPLAFQFGEAQDREAAELRVDALEGLGVSAYVLAVDYSDGAIRYRVFAGAFADATEASYLSGLLDERGLSSATLSDRTGRLPE